MRAAGSWWVLLLFPQVSPAPGTPLSTSVKLHDSNVPYMVKFVLVCSIGIQEVNEDNQE